MFLNWNRIHNQSIPVVRQIERNLVLFQCIIKSYEKANYWFLFHSTKSKNGTCDPLCQYVMCVFVLVAESVIYFKCTSCGPPLLWAGLNLEFFRQNLIVQKPTKTQIQNFSHLEFRMPISVKNRTYLYVRVCQRVNSTRSMIFLHHNTPQNNYWTLQIIWFSLWMPKACTFILISTYILI